MHRLCETHGVENLAAIFLFCYSDRIPHLRCPGQRGIDGILYARTHALHE